MLDYSKMVDEAEERLVEMLDVFESLLDTPELITPETKESFILFHAALDEFYSGKSAFIYNALKKL